MWSEVLPHSMEVKVLVKLEAAARMPVSCAIFCSLYWPFPKLRTMYTCSTKLSPGSTPNK